MGSFARLRRKYARLRHRTPTKKISSTLAVVASVITVVQLVAPVEHSSKGAMYWVLTGFVAFGLLQFLLLVRRWQLRSVRESRETDIVLARVMDELRRLQPPEHYRIIEWRELVEVTQQGTGRITALIRIQAGAEPVRTFWQKRVYKNDSPSQVKVRVYRIGPGGGKGVPCPVARTWDPSGMQIHAAFIRPIDPWAEATVAMELDWPDLGRTLLGRDSVILMRFARQVDRFRHQIKFGADLHLGDRLSIVPFFTRPDSDESGAERAYPLPEFTRFPSGELIVSLDVHGPDVNAEFGYEIGVPHPESSEWSYLAVPGS